MARLPTVGGDSGTWGSILNEFLEVSLNGDGTIQSSALQQAGAITSTSGLLKSSNNLSDVADAGSSRANLHIPYLTLAAACGNDIGGDYTAPSGSTGATFSPFSRYVDGYYPNAADMILLVNEAVNTGTGSNAPSAANGLWEVQTAGNQSEGGLWIRPTEFASGATIKGRAITVMSGAANSGPWYLQAPTAGIVIDSSSQTWLQATDTWSTSFSLVTPSGDSTGATDVTNINTALAAKKGVFLVPGATYYINSPITPISQSFLSGFQWSSASQQDYYGTGAGNPTGAVIQAVNFTGKAMILMENDTYTQYYGVDISGICLIAYGGAMPTTSHGIGAYGYWGACFLRGVQVQKPGCDCLHFDESPIVTSGFCDDWQITDCKFSGGRNGHGVNVVNNLADSWFDNCESSENALNGWSLGWVDNTRFSNCKGENNGNNGWSFNGTGSTNPAMLTGCSSQLNDQNGFLFGGGAAGSAYVLTGCRSSNNSQSAGTYAGFRTDGCRSLIMGTGCYATGDAYGAYEASSSYGMCFTGSYFVGSTANTYDDGSNTNALVNQSPAFGGSSGPGNTIDGVTVGGTPSTGQVITATSATAADWQTPASSFNGGLLAMAPTAP